ncbi:MAG: serine/threonine protein kinase [Planctomycetes bacterium]|nr:serine/threonine protein kinase [Planctomycetota bacterium]
MSTTIASDWDDLQRLFHAARDLDATQRAALLDSACGPDDLLRARLAALLAQHDRTTGVLEVPPSASSLCAQDAPLPADRRIGRYRILRVLGRGASGVVYEAQQDQPARSVALKILHAGLASERTIRRFEYEAELLARLSHPGIAQVLDTGTFEDAEGPRPYIAMELIEGVSLAEFAKSRQLSIRDRLEIMAQVCDAVDHAHQKGVIHRDLKPANILVTGAFERERAGSNAPGADDALEHPRRPGAPEKSPGASVWGRFFVAPRASFTTRIENPTLQRPHAPLSPKIVDFGIACDLEPYAPRASGATAAGRLAGTLAYMSPEQFSGAPIDRRADVYSLGVILYELLSGRLPVSCDDDDLLSSVERIQAVEPPLLGVGRPDCRGDIETIVAKTLEKDPARRYGSAGEFAADIRRCLRDEPIAARPATTIYQLRKFARRHRALVAGLAAVAGSLVLGVAGTTVMALREASARRWAESEQRRATKAMNAALTQLDMAELQNTNLLEYIEFEISDLPGATRICLELAESAASQLDSAVARAELDGLTAQGPRINQSYAHQRVGEARLAIGDAPGAVESFLRALDIRRRAVLAAPKDDRILRTLGVGHWKLGDALIRLDCPAAALGHFEEAAAIMRTLDRKDVFDQSSRGIYLGLAHRRLGDAFLRLDSAAEAADHYASAIRRFQDNVQAAVARRISFVCGR